MLTKTLKKNWRILGLLSLLIIFLSLIYFYQNLARSQNLVVSFLDVGQGDAILITTPNKETLLFDAGPSAQVTYKLEKYLPLFKKTLDYIIPTHPDADHVTGFLDILPKYRIKNILLNGDMDQTTEIAQAILFKINSEILNSQAKKRIVTCGDKILLSQKADKSLKLTLYILSPVQNDLILNETNDNSIVSLLTFGKYSFLLTGDISADIEKKLFFNALKCFPANEAKAIEKALKNLTVFKAPHHGSKTASSESLLKQITPDYTVISAGKNNRYGHPSPEALERLKKYSKNILNTINNGDITFKTNGVDLEIQTEK